MREDLMPNVEQLKSNFDFMHKNIKSGKIISSATVKKGGIAETIAKMTLGNRIGVNLTTEEELFTLAYGSFVVEAAAELTGDNVILLGETTTDTKIVAGDTVVDLCEMEKVWLGKLDPIFPHKTENETAEYEFKGYETGSVVAPREVIEVPKVFVPAFPGSNCEYDSMRAFERVGAEAYTMTFRNQSQKDINDSIDEMVAKIEEANILMFPGGFSAGDEPDGSGKFIATVLNNPKVAQAVDGLLKRDGLILGICNGFQALVKSGLLPYGKVGTVTENSPTLTFNNIGRHISQMVTTKVASNKSPWLNGIELGSEHQIAVSHGEGRFVAPTEVVKELFENGQVATQYVNFDGKPTTEFKHNPNGSVMAIEGITSLDGRIFGKMGHSERVGENLYKNIIGEKEQKIFENGVRYFTGK